MNSWCRTFAIDYVGDIDPQKFEYISDVMTEAFITVGLSVESISDMPTEDYYDEDDDAGS